jgi:ATP synthase protein I
MSEGDDHRAFEARLHAARARRGLDVSAAEQASARMAASAMGVGMRVGVELLSALVVGLAIGWGLDRWLHTSPIFLALFVVLGGGAGVANVWRLMAPGRMPGGPRPDGRNGAATPPE